MEGWVYLTYGDASLMLGKEDVEELRRIVVERGVLVTLRPSPSEVVGAVGYVTKYVARDSVAEYGGFLVGWTGEPVDAGGSQAELDLLLRMGGGVYISVSGDLFVWKASDGVFVSYGFDEPRTVVVAVRREVGEAAVRSVLAEFG